MLRYLVLLPLVFQILDIAHANLDLFAGYSDGIFHGYLKSQQAMFYCRDVLDANQQNLLQNVKLKAKYTIAISLCRVMDAQSYYLTPP
jgi:hypothetical protein